jgi:hypothetical protein
MSPSYGNRSRFDLWFVLPLSMMWMNRCVVCWSLPLSICTGLKTNAASVFFSFYFFVLWKLVSVSGEQQVVNGQISITVDCPLPDKKKSGNEGRFGTGSCRFWGSVIKFKMVWYIYQYIKVTFFLWIKGAYTFLFGDQPLRHGNKAWGCRVATPTREIHAENILHLSTMLLLLGWE